MNVDYIAHIMYFNKSCLVHGTKMNNTPCDTCHNLLTNSYMSNCKIPRQSNKIHFFCSPCNKRIKTLHRKKTIGYLYHYMIFAIKQLLFPFLNKGFVLPEIEKYILTLLVHYELGLYLL